MALIEDKVRSATAFSLEDCQLSVITPKTLIYLIENEPLTINPILQALSQRLRQTTKLLNDKMSTQHGSRTKHYIGRANRDNKSVIFYKGKIIFLEGQNSKCV